MITLPILTHNWSLPYNAELENKSGLRLRLPRNCYYIGTSKQYYGIYGTADSDLFPSCPLMALVFYYFVTH